jgi:DNA segregation ATPase FtsK/SpoIIIE, S-DNA-T family
VWRLACIGSGLCTVVNAASGPTQTTPTLVDVTLGPPTMLIVEPQPGQLAADIRNLAHRLAGTLGAVAPSVESHGPSRFAVLLITFRRRPRLRGRPRFCAGSPARGMDREIWRR